MVEIKKQKELEYWQNRFEVEGRLWNAHYRDLMLGISGKDESLFCEKIVADFGSGPRGSLCWLADAKIKIGIDVLVDDYILLGIREHDMAYIRSSETEIPLASEYVDVLFSINSLDHVAHLDVMLDEIFRVLRKGGLFAASLNLDEPATATEPQTLTEDLIAQKILPRLNVSRYKVAPRCVTGNNYQYDWAATGEERGVSF